MKLDINSLHFWAGFHWAKTFLFELMFEFYFIGNTDFSRYSLGGNRLVEVFVQMATLILLDFYWVKTSFLFWGLSFIQFATLIFSPVELAFEIAKNNTELKFGV